MPKYVAIAAAALFMTASAHASSGCSEKHENVSRFNPTELSDYQKCVYAWKGQTSGQHGNFVWFAVGDTFYEIQKTEILNTTGNDFEHLIVKTILEDGAAAKIAQYEQDIEVMSRLLGTNNEKVLELQTELDNLQRDIDKITSRTGSHTNTAVVSNWRGNYVLRVTEIDYDTFTHETTEIDLPDLEGLADLEAELVIEIRELMSDIAQEAYNEGYADGYRDGYAAGVASVTN